MKYTKMNENIVTLYQTRSFTYREYSQEPIIKSKGLESGQREVVMSDKVNESW